MGVILPISHKDPAIRSHGHRCWFTEVCGVIARHELLTQHERRLRFSSVELDDLVETNISYPSISLLINLQTVWHVEKARAKTPLDSPFIRINNYYCVFFYNLSIEYN